MVRTTCRWCDGALTKRQISCRRTYCSRSCAKTHYHAERPEHARDCGRRSWLKVGRPRFVIRLRAALAGCTGLAEAYRRGYANGYKVGATRRRQGRYHTRRIA